MPKPDETNNVNASNESADANNVAENANQNDAANQDAQQTAPQYVTFEAFSQMQTAVNALTDKIGEIMGGIQSIKDAQGVMVRAGATIVDDTEPEPVDDFKPLSELDFSVKK